MKLRSICTFGLLVLLPLAAACSRAPASQQTPTDDGGRPIGTPLVAFLSEARALHHKANLAEDARDFPAAIAALEQLVQAAHPASPEVDEVLADTDARLAELELESGLPGATTRANDDVQRGLARHVSPYFRGHLREVEGTVDEKRAGELADAGDGDGAAKMRKSASVALDEAVKIQDEVVRRSLDAGETSSP